ncbi:hypothetical protein [Brucella anthropi]|uniref:hypothetical protein n=1 Tax=Brucella anthropi TaxID=529 RepID=UPI001F2B3030|nr:hypothetical protein [Brucella anthropi]
MPMPMTATALIRNSVTKRSPAPGKKPFATRAATTRGSTVATIPTTVPRLMRTISILPNLWRRFPEPVPATNVNPENQYVNLVSFFIVC